MNYCCKSESKTLITIFANIFKVDGGDSVFAPCLPHVASQAPVLGVGAELQDLVILVRGVASIAT